MARRVLLLLFAQLMLPPGAVDARTVEIPAEAAGHEAKLGPCSWGGAISVVRATYGGKKPAGALCQLPSSGDSDVAPQVSAACDGRGACSFPVCPTVPAGYGVCNGLALSPPAIVAIGDPCKGIPKDFEVVYSCSAGWQVVFFLVLSCGVYVGTGVLVANTQRGAAIALPSHPHWAKWQEMWGLAADGLTFTARRLGVGGQRGGNSGTGSGGGSRSAGGGKAGEGPLLGSRSGNTSKKASSTSGKSKQKSTKSRGGSSKEQREAAPPPTTTAAAAVVPAGTSAAGGGGRWVHVSN